MESRHSQDHDAVNCPVSRCPHWPLATLGSPNLPGMPPSRTLASALPGEHFANRPPGLSQDLPVGELERGKEEDKQKMGGQVRARKQQGSWGSNCGWDFSGQLGDYLLPALICHLAQYVHERSFWNSYKKECREGRLGGEIMMVDVKL